MIQGLISANKNKIILLLLFIFFISVILYFGIKQPIKLNAANTKLVLGALGITLYCSAQIVVAIFVGRAIRGPAKRDES